MASSLYIKRETLPYHKSFTMETPRPLDILEAIDQLPPELKVIIYRYYVALRVQEKKTQVYFPLLRTQYLKFRLKYSLHSRAMTKQIDLRLIDMEKLVLYRNYHAGWFTWPEYDRYRRRLDRKERALLQQTI